MKKSIRLAICILVAVIGLVCIGISVSKLCKSRLSEKKNEKFSREELDWKEMKDTNEHIYAWIYVPKTNIDYPILQHPTIDSFYLEHDLEGESNPQGCIYSEPTYNETDFEAFHTVLYGHNMANGSMFHTLHNYQEETFFEENRYFYIYTPEGNLKYEIFAAYVNSDEHLLHDFPLEEEMQRQAYIKYALEVAKETGFVRDNIIPTPESHIITLSTCIGDDFSQRYLVQGVLTK